jgi:hypothetical protein
MTVTPTTLDTPFLANPAQDHILYWNEVALEANRRDFTFGNAEQGGPTLSSRALAIIHLAMYDAHAATASPSPMPAYQSGLPSAAGANQPLSVGYAAYTALLALYPRQHKMFDANLLAFVRSLDGEYQTGSLTVSRAFGTAVAEALLEARKDDPDANSDGYVTPLRRSDHEVDPFNPNQGFHAPNYGRGSNLFLSARRHGLDTPPSLGSAEYTKALKQVYAKGIHPTLMGTLTEGTKRTPTQTVVGIYWGYDGSKELGTPPRLYNQIVRQIAVARGNDANQNATLFALVNGAMGDAGVLAWEQKYIHNLWRPVVGVRAGDPTLGFEADVPTEIEDEGTANDKINGGGDALWQPLGAPNSNKGGADFTPPFPAYPSGHATFGAASLHITRLFYGVPADDRERDNLIESFISDEFNGATCDSQGVVRPLHNRRFEEGLWEMIVENGLSRVYLGVHWSFDAFLLNNSNKPVFPNDRQVGGVPLGLNIAEDIFGRNGGQIPPLDASPTNRAGHAGDPIVT